MNDRKAKRLAIRLVVKASRRNASQVCLTCGGIAASICNTVVKTTFGQWNGECDVCGENRGCGASRDFGYPDFRKVDVAEARRINSILDNPNLEDNREAWKHEMMKYPVCHCRWSPNFPT